MQAANGVMRLHRRVFLGARHLQPNCGGELGIERSGNVALQAVAHHHGAVRRDAKLTEQDLKNFRTRLPYAMFTGDRNRIEVATES